MTILQFAAQLAETEDQLWRDARIAGRREFLDHTRLIIDALSNLVVGPLSGLFDTQTNVDLAWDAPVQSMDLSLLRGRATMLWANRHDRSFSRLVRRSTTNSAIVMPTRIPTPSDRNFGIIWSG